MSTPHTPTSDPQSTTSDPQSTESAPQPGQAGPPAQLSSAEKSRKRLASYTFRNMIYSVLAVLGIAMVWWSLTHNPDELQRLPVEVGVTASYAADQAEWPVWVPEGTQGWTPTVVWFDERVAGLPTWHVSFVSPEGEYVALHQSADVTEEWVETVLREAAPVGSVVLPGGPVGEQTWQLWEGRPTSNAEVGYLLGPEASGGSTVVLHGTADEAEFEEFLELLQTR